MNNEGRWILVSDGTAQMLYAGKTTLSEEAIDEAMMAGRPIELVDCRSMRTLLVPSAQGFGQREILAPVSIARTGIRMKIKALSYFWPDEEEGTYASFLGRLEPALQSEANYRAAATGIITPSMSDIPVGKLRQ